MQIWKSRAGGFTQGERESLRRAIVANVLYLDTLFQEGGQTGQFAHSEMGRVGVDGNLGPWQTEDALYGLSDFADAGVFVDRTLARTACLNAIQSAAWLWPGADRIDPILGSVVFARLARCAARELSPYDRSCCGNALPGAIRDGGQQCVEPFRESFKYPRFPSGYRACHSLVRRGLRGPAILSREEHGI